MMIGALIDRLLVTAEVASIVGSRIYPGSVPQASPLPAIVVNTISGAPIYTDDGNSGLTSARVEISCWGATYTAAKELGNAVFISLSAFIGEVSGVVFQYVLLDIERDMRESGGNATEYRFRTVLDFIVWYER